MQPIAYSDLNRRIASFGGALLSRSTFEDQEFSYVLTHWPNSRHNRKYVLSRFTLSGTQYSEVARYMTELEARKEFERYVEKAVTDASAPVENTRS